MKIYFFENSSTSWQKVKEFFVWWDAEKLPMFEKTWDIYVAIQDVDIYDKDHFLAFIWSKVSLSNWFFFCEDETLETIIKWYSYHDMIWRILWSVTISEMDNKDKSWYVYLIRSWNKYKIWKSKDVSKRKKQLSIWNPEIKLVHSIFSDDHGSKEKQLHNAYKDKRISWEWFLLSESDVECICSMK